MQERTFRITNINFKEAVECYRYGLYWATRVMVRGAIDSSLFEVKNHVQLFPIKNPGGGWMLIESIPFNIHTEKKLEDKLLQKENRWIK